VPRQPTTWTQVSGYRFLLRRLECALLTGAGGRSPARSAPLAVGCVLAAVCTAGYALMALLRPQPALDRAQIVMTRESGALYVRVGDTWHPALNLASARLVAAAAVNPQLVHESDLAHVKLGPLLGIPGAPQLFGRPLSGAEAGWTICDADGAGATTIIVGTSQVAPDAYTAGHLDPGRAVLVAPPPGSPAYLLYDGRRAVVDLADAAVQRALRLEGRAPRPVSQALLNAIPETSPLAAPRVRGAGDAAAGLPGIPVGSVLRIARADGDEYYAVVTGGVQRIGRVAADMLRFSDARGTGNAVTVAPDAIRATPIVDTLPVASFPDRAPTPVDGTGDLCVTWGLASSGRTAVAFLVGGGQPVPSGQVPVTLSQADGHGPALDAVYLPPGRSAYVRGDGRTGTRYLVTETGVRFAVHDDDAANDLGLTAPTPAPWPVLTTLPSGPELSREKALVARDTVAGPP
jgi:type VII secretion protein EccB